MAVNGQQAPKVYMELTNPVHGGEGWELGTVLWSPAKDSLNKDMWRILKQLQPGDIVLHSVKHTGKTHALTGVSKVKEAYREVDEEPPIPGRWAGYHHYLRVPLEAYSPLVTPILLSAFLSEHQDELVELGSQKTFYTAGAKGIVQKYVAEVPRGVYSKLLEWMEASGTIGEGVRELVKPAQQGRVTAFSWQVIDRDTAVKKTDKSVFEYNQTGVPKKVTPYLGVEALTGGEKKSVYLTFEGQQFIAHFSKDRRKSGSVQLIWGSQLAFYLKNARRLLQEEYPDMVFRRTGEGSFALSLQRSGQAMPAEEAEKPLTVVPLRPKNRAGARRNGQRTGTSGKKIDYVAKAKRDKDLGLIGEERILAYERERLRKYGRSDLALKVEHIAKEKGDGEGYDILSFDTEGRQLFIEVKTTGGSCQDQFFISANELEFAKKHPENYYVYRLYHLMDAPKLAIYSVADLLKLKPIVTQYFMRAVPDEEGQE